MSIGSIQVEKQIWLHATIQYTYIILCNYVKYYILYNVSV